MRWGTEGVVGPPGSGPRSGRTVAPARWVAGPSASCRRPLLGAPFGWASESHCDRPDWSPCDGPLRGLCSVACADAAASRAVCGPGTPLPRPGLVCLGAARGLAHGSEAEDDGDANEEEEEEDDDESERVGISDASVVDVTLSRRLDALAFPLPRAPGLAPGRLFGGIRRPASDGVGKFCEEAVTGPSAPEDRPEESSVRVVAPVPRLWGKAPARVRALWAVAAPPGMSGGASTQQREQQLGCKRRCRPRARHQPEPPPVSKPRRRQPLRGGGGRASDRVAR